MVNTILKVKITGVTGAFIGHGIIIKDYLSRTFFVSDKAAAVSSPDANIEFAQMNIVGAPLYKTLVSSESIDSFATAICMIENRIFTEQARGWRLEPIGSIIDVNTFGYVFRFFDEFQPQISALEGISGVAIKPGYETTRKYRGLGGYHSYQRGNSFNRPLQQDKPWKIGIELELYARTQADYDKIKNTESNWFQCERDGSLSESGLGIEMKTIPLNACDAKNVEFWREPMDKLKTMATSKANRTTGLHVHIGKEILGENDTERAATIDKLCWFYTYYIEEVRENHEKNVIICGRENGYHCSINEIKTEMGDMAKDLGYKVVENNLSVFAKMTKGLTEKVHSNRWDINLQNINTYGTIEFRKGKGIISKVRIAALVTWWEQMVLYCRNTAPTELNFNTFFEKVCREYPAVSKFFDRDEEV